MVKFIMTIGNESYNVLAYEAKNRDVTVQQLLRAVVVPDWIKENVQEQNTGQPPKNNGHHRLPTIYGNAVERRAEMLVSPAARLSTNSSAGVTV
jgi:hypothetical protein